MAVSCFPRSHGNRPNSGPGETRETRRLFPGLHTFARKSTGLTRRRLALILFGTYLDIPAEPFQHLLPVRDPLTWLRRPIMPGSRYTHQLSGSLSQQLQGHIHLLGLRDRTAQIIFGMNEERWRGNRGGGGDRRALPVILGALRVPGRTLCLPDLPEADIGGSYKAGQVRNACHRHRRLKAVSMPDEKHRQIASAAIASHDHPFRIGRAACDTGIDPDQDILSVLPAPVPKNAAHKGFSTASASMGIAIEDRIPLRSEIVEEEIDSNAVSPVRAAMNMDHQGI